MEELSKHIAVEKKKAQELRRSRWWQNLIQSATCYYCHVKLDSKTATMDHVIPISRGGRSTKGNVVPCCKECNSKKRYLTPMEWDEFLKKASHPNTV
jgi:5-methylcytosine-specific restriction endonuclease McrA